MLSVYSVPPHGYDPRTLISFSLMQDVCIAAQTSPQLCMKWLRISRLQVSWTTNIKRLVSQFRHVEGGFLSFAQIVASVGNSLE
jgi:hypothetical protein